MEKVELYKQSIGKFIFSEFIVFLSQVAVFFSVAVFTSNFLSSEEKLVKFYEQKINAGTLGELGLTFVAIFLVIGLFSAIGRVFDNKYVEPYINEILCEMPKTIYVFGSSATGVMAAISLFIHLNPGSNTSAQAQAQAQGFAVMTLLFAIMMFIYGCAFSYAFKRKSHIKSEPNRKRAGKGREKGTMEKGTHG